MGILNGYSCGACGGTGKAVIGMPESQPPEDRKPKLRDSSVAMSPVAEDDPLMIAWRAFQATPEYANAYKWARYVEHIEGSLWCAFLAGRVSLREEAHS